MGRVVIIVASLLATCSLTACGGSSGSSDTEQVKAAFKTYVDAVSAHNGTAACAAMTPELVKQFKQALAQNSATAPLIAGKSCPQALELILNNAPELGSVMSALRKATLDNLHISGNDASFVIHANVNGLTVKVPGKEHKQNGQWRVSCCVGGTASSG